MMTKLNPTYVIIDGLNVMGRASNLWRMEAWFGLIQVLMILKSLSSRVVGGLEIITVLREHGAFEKDFVAERLNHISKLSRLILLSEKSEREDDDFLVMSLSKLYDGYFMSHDLSIQKHINESSTWANARRILIHLDPITRGIRLEIPTGVVSDGYAKMSLHNHLNNLLDDIPCEKIIDKEEESKDSILELEPVNTDTETRDFDAFDCLYCGTKVNSMEMAEKHSKNTGHNHYRAWSLRSGSTTLEGFE